MSDAIPQHRHCAKCGKAFTGGGMYCSEMCRESSGKEVRGKLWKLGGIWIAIVAATIVLILLVK